MNQIIAFLGSFNGGSQFCMLVANPFVKTPHGQNYDRKASMRGRNFYFS